MKEERKTDGLAPTQPITASAYRRAPKSASRKPASVATTSSAELFVLGQRLDQAQDLTGTSASDAVVGCEGSAHTQGRGLPFRSSCVRSAR